MAPGSMHLEIRPWKRSEATKAEAEFATEKTAWNGEDTPPESDGP